MYVVTREIIEKDTIGTREDNNNVVILNIPKKDVIYTVKEVVYFFNTPVALLLKEIVVAERDGEELPISISFFEEIEVPNSIEEIEVLDTAIV